MRHFPAFLDLADRVVVLVGSGGTARSKLRLLRAAGARVRWYDASPDDPRDNLDPLIEIAGPLSNETPDLTDVVAVVSAAGDPTDTRIAARAWALRLPVNVVDRPDLSSFVVPAIIDRGDVVVAIGTGGAAPVLARRLRERIEAVLPARIGELAALVGRYRSRLAKTVRSALSRRRFWERVVDGSIAMAALSGRADDAEAALKQAIAAEERGSPRGSVYLVGAGPGDADLLTLRALQALQGADIVFHDDAVSPQLLDRARRDAVRIPVAMHGRSWRRHQHAIVQRLVEAASRGCRVVLLGSGDAPDLPRLSETGVPSVIVPGLAAARPDARNREAA